MSEKFMSGRLPVLALRGLAIFPDQTVHFDVGRSKSVMALEYAMKHDQMLFLVPQKNIIDDDPGMDGLYPIGTVVKVKQILKSQNEKIRVLVTGLHRARLLELTQIEPHLAGVVEYVPQIPVKDALRAKASPTVSRTLWRRGTPRPLRNSRRPFKNTCKNIRAKAR